MSAIASNIEHLMHLVGPLVGFLTDGEWVAHANDPDAANFVVGNPHEMPLERFTGALQAWSVPQNKDWFAYKMSEASAQAVVGAALRTRFNLPFRDEDVHMTNGGFAALAVALRALVDAGDEVIFISPPWFFYELLIESVGAKPVRVKVNLQTFDLDVDAITAAITPRTRAIIVNSPNNPTGKIYPEATLRQLGQALTEASERNGRTIYMISDEAYNRIVYDGRTFITPTAYYPNSLLAYTYGKQLLTPGQRVGYLAVAPTMTEREMVNLGITVAQVASGYAFPNALLQHALGDLERMSIDIEHLQEKRDRMVSALQDMGYSVHLPEGTFYLMPKAPTDDDNAFIALLASEKIYCLPGWAIEMPGYFRLSLTANDAMIERALPGFARARARAVGASA